MSCAPHRLSAVSGLTRCGVLAMGQRLFKSDARLSGSNYTPITQQTLYAEDTAMVVAASGGAVVTPPVTYADVVSKKTDERESDIIAG